ncbi:MAG: S41 family peptidase [Bacteroidia bacterium]|nr:S41 family peptidase [Bacteroidia bacterium]
MKRLKSFRGFIIVSIVVIICIAAAGGNHNRFFEISKNLEIFTTLYKEVNTYYVDEVDPAKLMKTGVDAMLESLDPYTNYISESQIEGYRYMTDGTYNGIGARSEMIGEYVTITLIHKDNAAHKAGIQAGDQIISIDGYSAKGKTKEEVDQILRGFPGTQVKLEISRPGESQTREIMLTREEANISNVPYYGMVSDNVGYIILTTFTRNASKNILNALKELKVENPEVDGIILDLRNNGGGLLQEAVNITNIFIPKNEMVVTTKARVPEWDRSWKTLNNANDEDIKLAVLINNNSASASEIVSGVVQDLDRGVLVGQRSYGKGLVQNTKDIGYNSKVKITTAKYYIPSGRCIQAVEYENGEPVDIPDDRRSKFKTRNGRIVLDGGGVSPDVTIDKPEDPAFIKYLKKKKIIFHYATKFVQKNESIPAAKEFKFQDYPDFVSFVKDQGDDYGTSTEAMIHQLESAAEKDRYLEALKTEILALKSKLAIDKSQDLEKYKNQLINLIEQEIVSRYHFETGKVEISLRNDPEVKKTIDVLNDDSNYQGILIYK